MRALLPDPVADVDLHDHYAADWAERGGIRANMIASVDGAAAAGGLSGALQTPGDNRVYATLRDLADVVLVGSGTARAEGYRPVRFDDARLSRRRAYGFGDQLPIAVVSRSLRLDTSTPLFTDPDRRPLVITCGRTVPTEVSEVADVLVCGDDDIDYAQVRHELSRRGLTRVLCEGGPTILARVGLAGQLDELCLSLSPVLAGPGATRITAGDAWSVAPTSLRLHGLLEEDDALFARYVRRDAVGGPSQ